ncbi:hypothetical protein [Aeromicrobium sp. JJY06]|uniref:hypothetical protein n=1 Tax=Aeromicrobium sp. JJY06 TaxID=3373478 RepID=UPI00376F12F7
MLINKAEASRNAFGPACGVDGGEADDDERCNGRSGAAERNLLHEVIGLREAVGR